MAATASVAPIVNAGITIEKRSSTADTVAEMDPNSDIRIVEPSEYKQAALTLAEAFRVDHAVRYIIDTPDRAHWTEEQRFNLHRQALEYITYAHCELSCSFKRTYQQ